MKYSWPALDLYAQEYRGSVDEVTASSRAAGIVVLSLNRPRPGLGKLRKGPVRVRIRLG